MAVMNMNCSQLRDNLYVRETTKVSEIKDRFGNTRFKVYLSDLDDDVQDGIRHFDWQFNVTVFPYYCGERKDPVVIRDFDIYENAVRFFDDMTKQYAYLVQAETRDVQDIRVYAKRTGYHMICPNCCATCFWARPCDKENCLFDDWRKSLRGKFVCMNSELYRLPGEERQRGSADIEIRPVVDAMGLCSGFRRRADEKYKDPAHSERRFLEQDMAPDNRLETIAKYEVRQQMKDAEAGITRTVGEAIEQQLQRNTPIIEGNRNLGPEISLDGGGAN